MVVKSIGNFLHSLLTLSVCRWNGHGRVLTKTLRISNVQGKPNTKRLFIFSSSHSRVYLSTNHGFNDMRHRGLFIFPFETPTELSTLLTSNEENLSINATDELGKTDKPFAISREDRSICRLNEQPFGISRNTYPSQMVYYSTIESFGELICHEREFCFIKPELFIIQM